MTQDQYNRVALAVQAAVQQKQAADAQLAAVVQHPAVQQALTIEQQAKQAFAGLNLNDKTTAALLSGSVGALLGGGLGALSASDEDRLRNALIGALLVGSVGAGTGYGLLPEDNRAALLANLQNAGNAIAGFPGQAWNAISAYGNEAGQQVSALLNTLIGRPDK